MVTTRQAKRILPDLPWSFHHQPWIMWKLHRIWFPRKSVHGNWVLPGQCYRKPKLVLIETRFDRIMAWLFRLNSRRRFLEHHTKSIHPQQYEFWRLNFKVTYLYRSISQQMLAKLKEG